MKPNERLDLFSALDKVTTKLKQDEMFSLPVLAARAEKYAYLNPNDTALKMTANTLKKMASSKLSITRAELNKVYESFYHNGSLVKEIFASELARPELKSAKVTKQYAEDVEYSPSKHADQFLLNALNGAFEGKDTPFTTESASRAENACKIALASVGVVPNDISTFAGRDEFILCNASFDTSRGRSNILIPVEIVEGKATLPSVMISSAGFADLTKGNISEHVRELAGKSLTINSGEIFDVLKVARHGMPELVDDVDLAIAKSRAGKLSTAGSVFFNLDDEAPEKIAFKGAELSDEDMKFANALNNPRGQADFMFGKDNVNAGVSMIQRKLAQLGCRSVQIAVSSVSDDCIGYKVAVGSRAFSIPLKVENKRIFPPEVIISNGGVSTFNAHGLAKVISEDYESAASFSPSYALSSNELLDQVRKGIGANNRALVDDALDVLADTDPENHKVAVAMVIKATGNEKTASCGCSRVVKVSNSSAPMCGHLMLPLNKVFQDSKGYCRPLYRQGMSEDGQDNAMLVAAKLLGQI